MTIACRRCGASVTWAMDSCGTWIMFERRQVRTGPRFWLRWATTEPTPRIAKALGLWPTLGHRLHVDPRCSDAELAGALDAVRDALRNNKEQTGNKEQEGET